MPILAQTDTNEVEPFLQTQHMDLQTSCHDSAIGKTKQPKNRAVEKKVFTWKDEKGVTHFGERAPQHAKQFEEKAYSYTTKRLKEGNFDLQINLEKNAKANFYAYEDRLEKRIRNMYSVMQAIMGDTQILRVKIDLWLFFSYSEYQGFFRQHFPDNNANISGFLGFYIPREYIATAWARYGSEQLIKTATHEATHVFNHANFGQLPRWLNEGIAEYIEQISPSANTFTVKLNRNALNTIKRYPNALESIFFEQSWNQASTHLAYSYSWAFVYFLLSSEQGKTALANVLAEYQEVSCEESISINALELLNKYYGNWETLKADFQLWLNQTKTKHFYSSDS